MRPSPPLALLLAGATLATLGASAASFDGRPVPDAEEAYLNAVGGWRVFAPAATFTRSGELLVVWEGEKAGLLAQRFDREHRPAGDALILVANDLPKEPPYRGPGAVQRDADVVELPGRGFVLVWTETALDLDVNIFKEVKHVRASRIHALRLDAKGRPDGKPVALGGGGFEAAADAAALGNDEVVVVWQSTETEKAEAGAIWARRVDRKGKPIGEPFRVDDPEAGGGLQPVVTADGKSGFLVAWEGCCDAGGDSGIFARRFETAERAAGPQYVVNATTAGAQENPVIARGPDGRSLVAWIGPTVEPAGDHQTYGRLLGADGKPVGEEAALGLPFGRPRSALAVTAGSAGYLLAWVSWGTNFPAGVFGRHLDLDAQPLGEPATLSARPINIQWRLALGSDGGSHVVGAWESWGHDDKPAIAVRLLELRPPDGGAEAEAPVAPPGD